MIRTLAARIVGVLAVSAALVVALPPTQAAAQAHERTGATRAGARRTALRAAAGEDRTPGRSASPPG